MSTLFTSWVWSDEASLWRKLTSQRKWQKIPRGSYSAKRAAELVKREKKKGNIATARPSSDGPPSRPPAGKSFKDASEIRWEFIRSWLSGDLDANEDLLYRIARVAKDTNTELYVAEGTRSVADQWKYWLAYKAGRGPLAAYPGTSNHTWGKAADVRKDQALGSPNIGDIPGARKSMAAHGLCLPVPGETWHVELGANWRA